MISKKIQKNKGYTLLFSVLITALLLAIGLAILTISQKELILSSAGRESQFAFYAADTGVECAMYSDIGSHGSAAFASQSGGTNTISCNGQSITVPPPVQEASPHGYSNTVRFTFDIFLDPQKSIMLPCATVTVDKRYTDATTLGKTVVQSRGYNTCDTTDPRRVERGLQVSY